MKAKLLWAGCLAAVFLTAHLALLPSTLEDIDSLNFALGLHQFDPARHQPHPPGYPIFMALGKLARTVVPSDAKALALLGAIFGALALFPLISLFQSFEALQPEPGDPTLIARLAGALVVASPLYWFNALRPMSDIPGFAVTLAAQAVLADAFVRQRLDPSRSREALESSGRMIVLGAFLSAIAIGFRSQAAVLTLPLLVLVLLQRVGRGAAGALLGSAMTFGIGVLLWGVPLVIATGGIRAYRTALASQGGEDFTGVDMLYRNPTPRRFAQGLLQTFIYPWTSTALGWVVFGLAVVGMIALLQRSRRTAILLLVIASPYAVFHLLFQETITTRYALPLVPAVAYLAVTGLKLMAGFSARRGRDVMTVCVATLVVWSLVSTIPATLMYAHEGSPAFAAIDEIHRELRLAPRAAIGMHQGLQRPAQTQDFGDLTVLKAPPMREWLELGQYWLSGGSAPVWFLADPARTDLELVDPLSRSIHRHYVWSFPRDKFISGVRPDIVDLVRIESPPGWFGDQGWHLTPELLNMSERLKQHEAIAYVKSRRDASVLVLGAESTGAAAELTLAIDGKTIGRLTVPAGGALFHRRTLPAGALAGVSTFRRLTVSYADRNGLPEQVRLTQFAIEPQDAVFFVQQQGWNEIEYSREQQRRWRWTTGRATTFINSGGRDVLLTIAGESPLKYFGSAPHVTVRAGTATLASASPDADFELKVNVPATVLDKADGMLTIETDKTFVPSERSRSGDHRRLGLRIFTFAVTAS